MLTRLIPSDVAPPGQDLSLALQWTTLAVAVATLAGLLTGAVEPTLARLMALSLGPLLSLEFVSGPFRPAQTAAAAALGAGAAAGALSLGALGAAVLLQGAVVVFGLMVLVAVAVRLRELDTRLRAATLDAALASRRAAEAESTTLRLGGAAHDINNLLTVVAGSAEMLLLRPLPDRARRDAERLDRAADKAMQLGRELLAASSQQAALPVPVNLNGVLAELLPILEQILHGHTLSVAVAPEALVANVPPGATEQIVLNLVTNARSAEAQRVTVRLCEEGGRVLLEVEDDGVGMDEGTLARACEPLFTTRKRTGGSGMGLYTVFKLVDDAGGEMEIDSQKGAGTRVSVRLPIWK